MFCKIIIVLIVPADFPLCLRNTSKNDCCVLNSSPNFMMFMVFPQISRYFPIFSPCHLWFPRSHPQPSRRRIPHGAVGDLRSGAHGGGRLPRLPFGRFEGGQGGRGILHGAGHLGAHFMEIVHGGYIIYIHNIYIYIYIYICTQYYIHICIILYIYICGGFLKWGYPKSSL